ncbi:MAG: hypothetical protein ABI488_26635 [Polyangiaceae bacterium]
MPNAWGFIRSVLTLGCAVGLSNCDQPSSVAPPPATRPAALKRTQAVPKPGAAVAQPSSDPTPEPLIVSEIPDEAPAPGASASAAKPVAKLIIDQPVEIGPAGQMSADEHGVVILDRSDRVQIAKRAPSSASSHREQARFSDIHGGFNDFYAVARGPLLLRGKAYWVRDGKLVRRALDNSTPLEVLASDARNGTRVVGADIQGAPAHAVYISNPLKEDAPPRAKLWTEGAETLVLSPEGAGASSVAVANSGGDLYTVAIDARSAMTPMHGRRVHFKAGKPELAPDVVMWVGASSQTASEVFATATPFGVRAFLPIERDISHFGLVMLDLSGEPHMDPKTFWRGYPNGIDVAPVASGAWCGSAFVAYVRPQSESPESHQVLELAEITAQGLGQPELVDNASGFANVSLGAGTDSAVLAYVADYRTFATTLRCSRKK